MSYVPVSVCPDPLKKHKGVGVHRAKFTQSSPRSLCLIKFMTILGPNHWSLDNHRLSLLSIDSDMLQWFMQEAEKKTTRNAHRLPDSRQKDPTWEVNHFLETSEAKET